MFNSLQVIALRVRNVCMPSYNITKQVDQIVQMYSNKYSLLFNTENICRDETINKGLRNGPYSNWRHLWYLE